MTEKGEWFQTVSGRKIYVLDPDPELIVIGDIAHALARICRFGGHVKFPHYSVAQHSFLVSTVCNPENAFIGLLHDASEAYIGDMIRPLKKSIPRYKEIEFQWDIAIDRAFDLYGNLAHLPDDVKCADVCLLATERRDLMNDGPGHHLWNLRDQSPMKETIIPLDPESAEEEFLSRFRALWR